MTESNNYHVITTDSPLFEALGLSVFTTGTMWDFLTHKDQAGVENFRYFSGDALWPWTPSDMTFIFRADGGGNLVYWMESYDPISNKHATKEEDKDILDNWKFVSKKADTYNTGHLPALGVDRTYSSSDGPFLEPGSAKFWRDPVLPPPAPQTYLTHADIFGLGNGEKVAQVIETNNWVRLKKEKEDKKPLGEWTGEGGVTAAEAIAAFYWIADIKSSKYGKLEWITDITFNLTPRLDASHPDACLKTEPVHFKLSLFDNEIPRNPTKSIVTKSVPTFVGLPMSEIGIKGKTEDGHPIDESTKTVHPIDIVTDSITGKGRSGSLQVIAKLTTELPAADDTIDTPSVKDQNSNASDFTINDLYAAFRPGSGLAMPLQAQNKNPNQWSPVWSNAKCNSSDKNTPQQVKVMNFSKRSYAENKTVLLNQLGGSPGSKDVVWCVIDFGDEAAEVVSQTFEGKWDFTYLMANGDHYFRKWEPDRNAVQGTHESFKNTYYELQFRHQYYGSINNTAVLHQATKDDGKLNWLETDGAFAGLGSGDGPASINPFNPRDIEFCVEDPSKGFYQITSWDFMHGAIGGTRGTHNSIVQTQAELDYDGEPYGARNEEPEDKDGIEQLPFFGAVFPGGYNHNSVNSYKTQPVTFKAINNDDVFWTAGNPGSPFGESLTSNNLTDPPPPAPSKGMFSDKLVGAGLPHFPADMALHSSPDGDNGRPISSVNWMKQYMTLKPLGGDLYTDTIGYFGGNAAATTAPADQIDPSLSGIPTRYSYLQKDNGEEAFDLPPTSQSKVQFRPLMAETYLSFVGSDQTGTTNPNDNSAYINLVGNPVTGPGGNYEVMLTMSQKGWASQNGQGSTGSPISPVFLARNGLTVSADVNEQGPRASSSLRRGIKANGNFPDEVWGAEPANAFGIIGAVCTVKSVGSNSLSFDVGCNIGIRNGGGTTRGGGFSMMSSFMQVNFSIGQDRTDGEVYYWGSSSDNPESFFTTNLHVRVFNAWPRNLTVYDTRFYAVHHFNHGVGYELDDIDYDVFHKHKAVGCPALGGDTNLTALFNHVCPAGNGNRMEDATSTALYDSDNQIFQGAGWSDKFVGNDFVYYPVDKIKIPEADFREPTYSNRGGHTDNRLVAIAGRVFKDSGLRSETEWRVNAKARGKLLPFRYNRKTIGVGQVGDLLTVKDRNIFTGSISNAKIVTQSVGTGYISEVLGGGGAIITAGDTFTTRGGGGTGVVLKLKRYIPPTVPGASPVFDLEIVNPGKDFQPGDFLDQYDDPTVPTPVDNNVDTETESSVKIVPLSVQGAGSGFEGWITFGEVANTVEEIAKPAECGQELLSPATKNLGYINVNGYRQFLTWGDEKRSPDDKYDVFLYFHNDIGHTLAYVQDYGIPPMNSKQQWLNVTVLPN